MPAKELLAANVILSEISEISFKKGSEKLRLVEIHDDGFLTFLWIIFNDSSRYNQGRKYFAFIVENPRSLHA